MNKERLQQALDALIIAEAGLADIGDAIVALKIAIAQLVRPVQPEVSDAYDQIDRYLRNNLDDQDYADHSAALETVFAANISQRVPLTDKQIYELWPKECMVFCEEAAEFAYAIEAAHGIGSEGGA